MRNEEGVSSILLLISDDRVLVRSGQRGMLQRELSIEIVGEALQRGHEAVELCHSLGPHLP
jgi:DNA-binding NarL/FixJ family response regulator